MKIEFTTTAYATSEYSMRRFMECFKDGDHQEAGDHMCFSYVDMSSADWVKLGQARIMVELLPIEDMQSAQLDALKTKLHAIRAENQQRENAILDAISKLTALEYVEG